MRPGARVLDTYGAWGDRVAFVNPDGEVVVLGNSSDRSLSVAPNLDGRRSATVDLPAHSFDTFTLSPEGTPSRGAASLGSPPSARGAPAFSGLLARALKPTSRQS